MKRWSAALLLAATTGCGAAALSAVPVGAWGGEHVSMDVTGAGATLQFDCAHGSVTEPLTLDADGRFDRIGVFVLERPGPVHPGEVEDARPARYAGTTDGSNMQLTITVQDGSVPAQSFALTLGNPGRVVRCL